MRYIVFESIVEFFGSLIYAYVVILAKTNDLLNYTLVPIIIVMSKYSGDHFNPILTVTMTLLGLNTMTELIVMIPCQILGAICAYFLYKRFH